MASDLIKIKPEEIQKITPAEVILRDDGFPPRCIERASLYLERRPELRGCTQASVVDCVLQAAELGLYLDGRLAHAVKYGKELQLMVDYKGFIAIVKMKKILKDVYARLVHANDKFSYEINGDQEQLRHSFDVRKDRGAMQAVYAALVFHDGRVRYDFMGGEDLRACRNAARTQKVWDTWPGEMAKKSVIRRALKTYCDDPALGRAYDLDADAFEAPEHPREISLGTIDSIPTDGRGDSGTGQDLTLGKVNKPASSPHSAVQPEDFFSGNNVEELRGRLEQVGLAAQGLGITVSDHLPDGKTTDEMTAEECNVSLDRLGEEIRRVTSKR
jgi:phage RecT family recombinase